MNESNLVTCSGRLRSKHSERGRGCIMKSQMDHALKCVDFILKDEKPQEDFIRGRGIIKLMF